MRLETRAHEMVIGAPAARSREHRMEYWICQRLPAMSSTHLQGLIESFLHINSGLGVEQDPSKSRVTLTWGSEGLYRGHQDGDIGNSA